MQTPSKKGVRWAFDVANSPFGGHAEPSTPETSTSSLAYVNSQIIAHGFARAPLDLADLGRDEQNKVVKCVLGMLSQRVDDMTRAEDLSSRLRTLSYEHERLGNMLRSAKSQVVQAEKETEAAKTKASALTKDLSSATAAHARTSNHLAQQTSAIASLRQASTALDRKREQDVARLKERWQKLASEQSKLGSVGSGLVCANWAVVDQNEQYVGTGESVEEGAIRDAVEARERLTEENDVFREVLGKLGAVVGECLRERDVKDVKIPTTAALFQPPSSSEDAGPALNAYRTLRDLIHQLAISTSSTSAAYDEEERAVARAKAEEHRVEISKWEERVEGLERDIARLKGELAASNDFAEKGRVLIEQMANDRKVRERKEEEHSAGEAAALAAQRQELEAERAKFTDAAIKLARERSDFEAERLQFAEEKRIWTMQRLEAEQPSATATEPEPEPTAQADANTVYDPASPPKANSSLGDALRTVLKAEKDAEKRKRKEERGRLMKPSSPAKTKIGKREREGDEGGKEKKRRAPPQPVFVKTGGGSSGQVVVGSTAQTTTGSSAQASTGPPTEQTAGPSQVADAPSSPKSKPTAVPTTPRSLHPAAQRARARNYAPAVPSPLSRILTMAESPEERRNGPGQVAGGLGADDAPPGLNGGMVSPGRGGATSPGRGGGVRSPGRPKGGLAVKFAAAAAKAKEVPKPEPRLVSMSETRADKGKGKAREDEEREKDEGRDLDAILAAPVAPGVGALSRPGGSRAVPKTAVMGKPMRVAVKRGATPRKATVGNVRAKRRG